MMYLYFFFFQAEDGIRDLYVTGVQTCALPILAGDEFGDLARGRRLLQADVGAGARDDRGERRRCRHLAPIEAANERARPRGGYRLCAGHIRYCRDAALEIG